MGEGECPSAEPPLQVNRRAQNKSSHPGAALSTVTPSLRNTPALELSSDSDFQLIAGFLFVGPALNSGKMCVDPNKDEECCEKEKIRYGAACVFVWSGGPVATVSEFQTGSVHQGTDGTASSP